MLTEYLLHYNTARPHRALCPLPPAQEHKRPREINLADYRILPKNKSSADSYTSIRSPRDGPPCCCEKKQVTATIVYSSPTGCQEGADQGPSFLGQDLRPSEGGGRVLRRLDRVAGGRDTSDLEGAQSGHASRCDRLAG